jgi:hypothetical protein
MLLNNKIKRGLFSVVVCLISFAKVYGQDNVPPETYIASYIPDSLKTDANSVVRYNLEDYNVLGPGKEVYTAHTIVTVLNEKGNHEAEISLPYNKKFSAVTAFEMRIYDAAGKLIKKYHKSDLYEHAAEEAEALVTDDRIKYIGHTIANYPTTVEMIFEIDRNSLINLGGWAIQEPEQSVQHSTCRISIAANAGFRYLNKNTSIKPRISGTDERQIYTWTVSNLKAFKVEEGAMPWRVLPEVEFLQNKFEYFGLPGDLNNWQNYGKWQQILNADVCNLSPQRIAEIKKMTDTIKTDKDKVRFLYKYMQQNMRYVNIKLGIGGLKPFPASFVDEKKYGDCKALSNYMRSLLKAIDINSYYAEINAGANEEPANYSFPYDPFNHIILCVPLKNDTTWLECTSNTMPFGVLGSFTENRNALLITEDGGKLVNTPKTIAQENQFNSAVHIVLDADGGAKTQVKILSTGEYRELFLGMSAIKLDDQKEFLLRDLHIKQPSAFEFKSEKDENGTKEIDLNLEYDQFCDVKAGDKQFYRPLAFLLWSNTVPVLEKRQTDYYWDYPRIKTCTTTIDIPTGFEMETLPPNASFKFTYGNYEINYVYNKDKNQVISTAKFILNNQVIPAAKYTEMQQYMDGVAKAQNKKLVIKKKA